MDVMKRLFSLAVMALVFNAGAQAQGFYIKGGLGYGFAQAGSTIDNTSNLPYNGQISNTTSGANSIQSYSVKKASFSAGLNGVAGCGYMFNKNIGIELDAAIGLAAKKYTGTITNIEVDSIASDLSTKQYAKTPVVLMPAIVLQTGGDVVNFYARGGIVLPLNSKIIQEQALTNEPGTGALETDVFTWQQKNYFSLGYTGAIGMQYRRSKNVSFWVEATLLSMSLYTKEADLTDVTVDGSSGYLSQVPTNQRVVKYSYNVSVVNNDPYHQPVFTVPFSNVGINAGIKYTFNRKEREKRPAHSKRNEYSF
jgi:Outer membrane protein beta-barrel domain